MQHPLWFHDIDQNSLAIEQTRKLLQDWMAEITRNEIIANLQMAQTHTRGPRATSSEERDS
jgi:hypothetical protein